MKSEAVENFWREFCAAAGVDPATPYQVWYFSDHSEQARALARLVVDGPKRATASLVEFNDAHPHLAPIDGGYSVVTDFEGDPQCVIETTEIRRLPFREVDAAFAYDEGEGDRTLADWREAHRAYFAREAAAYGYRFDDDALVCCERFRLRYPLK